MFAHMPTTLLRGGRPAIPVADPPSDRLDLRLGDGVVIEVGPTLQPRPGEEVVELDGYVISPAAVEPHAHLDKAFLAERITNDTGDLMGAILAMRANRHLLGVPETVERAERAARLMVEQGYRAVRTHADLAKEHGLRSIEALTEVRRRLGDLLDIEIVALTGWPVLGSEGAAHRALLMEALDAGADLVGGCPHLEPNGAARAATGFLLETANDAGVGVDLHTDETLDGDVLGLLHLVDAIEQGFSLPITASHCVSLGVQTEDRQREIAERVAASGIGIVVLPHTNLFLQGRGHAPMPRGLTAVAALREAGASLAAGADNIQDPFNPVGRVDPLETAGLMIMTSHLLPADAWATVTSGASTVVGIPPGQLAQGDRADLLAVRATTLREAIAFGPADRIVWRHGVRLAR